MKLVLLFFALFLLQACEAPLNLLQVESTKLLPVHRTDVFMSAVNSGNKTIVVGSDGVILTGDTISESWKRTVIKGKPDFIDITSCSNDLIAALSMEGQVWISNDNAKTWQASILNTLEIPQAITCDDNNLIWVVGSFTTILSSTDAGNNWTNHSLDEDIILSTIQFTDNSHGIITGEFGTVLLTNDGGESWTFAEPIPKDFLPLTAIFKDKDEGWVAGLNGIIYATNDGALTWHLEKTNTNAPIFGLSLLNNNIVAVGDYGTVIHKNINDSFDDNWKELALPYESRFFFRVSHQTENNKLIIAGAAGSIHIVDLAHIE